jgi:hypothetical protein
MINSRQPIQPLSTADPRFLKPLESWFSSNSEILILIRYSHAAGSKSFELFRSFSNLRERLSQLPISTNVIAFKHPQLPLRGMVDDNFIAQCLSFIPDGTEFLLLETGTEAKGSDHVAGESHSELRGALESLQGCHVFVGKYPPCWDESPALISGYVPDKHGVVKIGAY